MANPVTYEFVDDAAPSAPVTYEFVDDAPAASKPAPKKAPRSTLREYMDLAKNSYSELKSNPLAAVAAPVETGISALTGLASTATGGLAGLARTGYGLVTGEGFDEATSKGADVISSAQNAATYQPRTETGKLTTRVLGAPVEALTHVAGGGGEELGRMVNGDKGALAGRAIGETAAQALPLMFGLKNTIQNRGSKGAPAANRVPVAGEDYTPLREFTPIQKQRLTNQQSVGTQPTLGSVLRDPTQLRFENLIEQQPEGVELRQRTIDNNQGMLSSMESIKGANAGIRAEPSKVGATTRGAILEQEAADAAGVRASAGGNALGDSGTGEVLRSSIKAIRDEDWKQIGTLFDKARESKQTQETVNVQPLLKFFDDNDIAAETTAKVLKQASGELGKIIKNKTATNVTEVTKRDKFGAPYKEQIKETVSPITIDDIEKLRASISKAGRNTTDGATRFWAGEVTKKIDEITSGKGGGLYQQARRARYDHEMKFNQPAAIQRVIGKKSDTDYRNATEELFNGSVIKGSEAELSTLVNTLKSSEQGAPALAALKKQAAEYARTNGIDKIGESKLKLILDDNAIGKIKDYNAKYKDNTAVAKLIEKVSPSDYRITLDEVFKKSVIGAAPEEIASLTKVLDSTPKGKQAIEQLRINAIDYLIDGFTRTVGKNEAGQKNAGTAGLKQAISNIGEENLKTLLGEKDTAQIMKVLSVSDDLTTNSSRLRGSSTVTNAQTVLDKVKQGLIRRLVSKLPKVGPMANAAVDLLAEQSRKNILSSQIDDALNPMRMGAEGMAARANAEKAANKANRSKRNEFIINQKIKQSPLHLSEIGSRKQQDEEE